MKTAKVIGSRTCRKCGSNLFELNEFLLCSKCMAYCQICGKKLAEFGNVTATRCIDCRHLGDRCFVKTVLIKKH